MTIPEFEMKLKLKLKIEILKKITVLGYTFIIFPFTLFFMKNFSEFFDEKTPENKINKNKNRKN